MADPTPHGPAELLAAAKDVTGDGPKALQLIMQPQAAFGGLSLIDIARQGRLQDALAYLQSIASGFAG